MDLPVNYEKTHHSIRKKVREEYIRRQDGKCWHCKEVLYMPPTYELPTGMQIDHSLFPPKFFDYPVHLHHSHDTGMTIGAVHAFCNAVLWQYHGE